MGKRETKGKGLECGRKMIQGIERALVTKGIPYLLNRGVYRFDYVVPGVTIDNLVTIQVDTAQGVLEIEQRVFNCQRGKRITYYRTEEVQTSIRFAFGIGLGVYHRQDHTVFVELDNFVMDWDSDTEIDAMCELLLEAVAGGLLFSPI